jgi:hypothetical protein
MAGFSITLYWLFCYGQNTTKKKPLTGHYFPRKQFTHQVFVCRWRCGKYCNRKAEYFLYIETIDYLNSKTFELKALDDRYVTVSVLNKTISVCGIVSDEKNLV